MWRLYHYWLLAVNRYLRVTLWMRCVRIGYLHYKIERQKVREDELRRQQ